MSKVCHTLSNGKILNADKTSYPLFQVVLYGDKIKTKKFSKRLSCAIKHLPLRVKFIFEYDTLKAVENGIVQDPTLVLDREIFLEGLVQAETITEAFKKLLKEKDYAVC